MFKLRACGTELPPHVSALLRQVLDLDDVADLGCSTVLHDAVLELGDFSVREVLSRTKVDMEARDELGFSALHWAVVRRRPLDVHALLKHGAAVNAPTMLESWSPLHLACMFRDLDLTGCLIEAGADVNSEDFRGCTPIHFVADTDEICGRLIAAGADRFHRDFNGNNPLHSLAKVPTLEGSPRRLPWYFEQARLFEDENLWSQMNDQGERPMQIAAMFNPGFTLSFHKPRAPMSIRSLSLGRNLLHFFAMYWKEADVHSFIGGYLDLRYMIGDTSTDLDPEALDDEGMSPMNLLERRMFDPDTTRPAGVLKPSYNDVHAVVYLLDEARQLRWHHLYEDPRVMQQQKTQLENRSGSARKVTLWLRREEERLGKRLGKTRPTFACDAAVQMPSETWTPSDQYPWWRDIDDNDSELSGVNIEFNEYC